jgi:hypothetical protein
MMVALGYKVSAAYLADLMDLFGDFDKDADGVVEFGEFKKLWEHLGAGHDAEAATAEVRLEPSEHLTAEYLRICLK